MPRGGARANSGGARPNTGGARPGAGRPSRETARRLAVELTAAEAAALDALQARLQLRTASDVVRRALVELAERQSA